MKVVSVGNLKGGVGKTTLAVLLTRYLAHRGKRVLLVDMDPQATASMFAKLVPGATDEFGNPVIGVPFLVEEFLKGEGISSDVVMRNVCAVPVDDVHFYLLPNFIKAQSYEGELTAQALHIYFLKRVLAVLRDTVDVVVCDCSPYLNAYFISSLAASHMLLVPVEASLQAIPSVDLMLSILRRYTVNGIIGLQAFYLVPTKVRKTKSSEKAFKYVQEMYGDYLTENYLPALERVNSLFSGRMRVGSLIRRRDSASKRIRSLLEEIESIIDEVRD